MVPLAGRLLSSSPLCGATAAGECLRRISLTVQATSTARRGWASPSTWSSPCPGGAPRLPALPTFLRLPRFVGHARAVILRVPLCDLRRTAVQLLSLAGPAEGRGPDALCAAARGHIHIRCRTRTTEAACAPCAIASPTSPQRLLFTQVSRTDLGHDIRERVTEQLHSY